MCFVSKTSKKPMDWEAASVLGVGEMALCDVIVPGFSMGKAITVFLVKKERTSSDLDKHGAASLLHHLPQGTDNRSQIRRDLREDALSPAPQP